MTARVTLYSKPGCHLCDDARAVIERVCAELGESFDEVSILDDPELRRRFAEEIPVTFVDGAPARLLAGRRGPAAGRASRPARTVLTVRASARRPSTRKTRSSELPVGGRREATLAGFVLAFTNSYSGPRRWSCAGPMVLASSGWREGLVTARTTDSARDIPEATVARLPVYLRALTTLAEQGTTTCSSEELAAAAGVNSAKLRKDLSYLGSYGTRGVGYDVDYLRYQIAREIGVTQDWPVVIVGIGNLGHALANFSGFRSRGFRVVALLDADPERHGESVAGIDVRAFDDLEQIVARARRRHRRHRHPGAGRPGRRGPDGRGRDHQHPQLRADRDLGARRRRRPQGRPLHRAADPRLPRAAQAGGGATA